MDYLTIGLVIGAKELWDEVQSALYEAPVRVVMEQNEIGEWGAFLEKLERARPDILLVDFKQLIDPLDDVVRQIKATSGSPMVIVVHTSADPDTILRAIRASADEYLYPPLKDDLRKAIDRIGGMRMKLRAGTRPRGKVLGFFSAKGGCGSTTLACHLAVQLHQQTKLEVLLADFDLDAGVIGFLMKSQCRYSLLDAVDNVNRMDLSFWKALVSNGIPGVEVIMAPSTQAARKERSLEDFRNILRFVRSNYDWTVVDLGRSLSPLSMTVLEELDEVYLITTLDIPALHQAKSVVQTLLDMGYARHRLRVILNRAPKRMDITIDELEKMVGVPIYATLPSDYPGLYEAYAEGGLLPAKSPLGKHFSRIAAKIAGVGHQETKKRFSFIF
jgi:pilus assembly protein CpaE